MTKTLHRTLPVLLLCLSKTGPCAVISYQICFKYTGEVLYKIICMPPFSVLKSMLSMLSKNEGFSHVVIVATGEAFLGTKMAKIDHIQVEGKWRTSKCLKVFNKYMKR